MYITYYETTRRTNTPVTFEELMAGAIPELPQQDRYRVKTKSLERNELTDAYIQNLAQNIDKVIQYLSPKVEKYRGKNMAEYYTHFEIPKASGGSRPIDAPIEELKQDQKLMKQVLEQAGILSHTAAYAYVPHRCARDAVERHQKTGHKFYLKLDLHNFFGSCAPEFVYGQLEQIPLFYSLTRPRLADLLHPAFLNNKLPQGSPLSPWLTNQIMLPFDFQMTQFCQKHNVTYTRYADDMLFSANFNPKTVVLQKARELLQDTPLRLNQEKTRVSTINGRNWNLGILVNQENKMSVGYRRKEITRARLTDFCNNHNNWTKEQAQELFGTLEYLSSIEPEYFQNLLTKYSRKFMIDIPDTLKQIIKQR